MMDPADRRRRRRRRPSGARPAAPTGGGTATTALYCVAMIFLGGIIDGHRGRLHLAPLMGVDARPVDGNGNGLDSFASRSRGSGGSSGRDGGGSGGNTQGSSRSQLHPHSRDVSNSRSRADVALRDSFPCESDGLASTPRSNVSGSGISSGGGEGASNSSASAGGFLGGNSFAAMNDLDGASSPAPAGSAPSKAAGGNPKAGNNSKSPLDARGGAIIGTISEEASRSADSSDSSTKSPLDIRGGAIADGISTKGIRSASSLDDDELDQMVDDLIAGLDDEDENESEVESEVESETESEEGEESEVGKGNTTAGGSEGDLDAAGGNDVVEEGIDEQGEGGDEEEESEGGVDPTNADTQGSQTAREGSDARSSATTRPPVQPSPTTISIPTTPTNAYYRFLVRRGPKGHVLAAFTLVAVQWIHVYAPHLYRSVAGVLLKLRIYDPKILHERERRRRWELRYGPPPKKKGLTSKLFGTSKSKSKGDLASQKKAMQKRRDEEAASKLKQLYKTMKVGGGVGMLSEVRYRYLSVGFRRRHGLGKEYRAEKPRSFMGEVVEGSGGAIGGAGGLVGTDPVLDDVVLSDAEEPMDGAQGVDSGEKMQQKSTRRTRPKRKRINDWVVRAFATSPPRRAPSKSSPSKGPSQLWGAVERDAIIAAAWESRAAEQLATAVRKESGATSARGRGKAVPGRDHDRDGDIVEEAAATSSGGGGYGASKMFQSVMTRVGSNGRIFGAYPNDAPPIEECANERGVLGLARRYGYGDWRADDLDRGLYGFGDGSVLSDEDDEGGDLSWGGGDLLFGDDEDAFGQSPSLAGGEQKSRRRRRKKRQSSSTSSSASNLTDVERAVVKKTKRRKRGSKGSVTL